MIRNECKLSIYINKTDNTITTIKAAKADLCWLFYRFAPPSTIQNIHFV